MKDGEDNLVGTEYGWAIEQDEPPQRKDLYWLQKSSGHLYTWDGDGWFRIIPPERPYYKDAYLDHA